MKKLVLCGSGEFTYAMDDVDRKLLSSFSSSPTIGVVPAAAGKEKGYRTWIEKGKSHFISLGARPIGIDISKRSDAMSPLHLSELEGCEWIYFSGGDPGYLRSVLVNSLFWGEVEKKYEQGMLLAGSSAGAMVMGSNVLVNPFGLFFSHDAPMWESGFNLVNYVVYPHFDRMPPGVHALISTLMKEPYLGIDEDTALVIIDGQAEVDGNGKVLCVNNGSKKIYRRGDTFSM